MQKGFLFLLIAFMNMQVFGQSGSLTGFNDTSGAEELNSEKAFDESAAAVRSTAGSGGVGVLWIVTLVQSEHPNL